MSGAANCYTARLRWRLLAAVLAAGIAVACDRTTAGSAQSDSAPSKGTWKEGIHYEPITPAEATGLGGSRVQVIEFFSFACGACYALEPHVVLWKNFEKPDYVEFVRIPAVYDAKSAGIGRLFYTLGELNRHDLDQEVFDTVFQSGKKIEVKNDFEATFHLHLEFAKAHGMSASEFERAYRSPTVDMKLQAAETLTRRYQVETIPLIIVNGKYKVTPQLAGGESSLIAVTHELVTSENRG